MIMSNQDREAEIARMVQGHAKYQPKKIHIAMKGIDGPEMGAVRGLVYDPAHMRNRPNGEANATYDAFFTMGTVVREVVIQTRGLTQDVGDNLAGDYGVIRKGDLTGYVSKFETTKSKAELILEEFRAHPLRWMNKAAFADA